MRKVNPLDYFAGGVPASAIFEISVIDIKRLIRNKPNDDSLRTLEEICFIGLVSYFEAFCRDCFASIINIAPSLLASLKAKSYDINIDSLLAVEMHSELSFRVGFMVAENLDFGTARKINAIYSSLLGIAPFRRKEQKEYDQLLSDRNLLVHHGGIYTQSYLTQRLIPSLGLKRIFMDSLRIDALYLNERIKFLLGIAKKIVKSCQAALYTRLKSGEIVLSPVARRAFKLFAYWDEKVG